MFERKLQAMKDASKRPSALNVIGRTLKLLSETQRKKFAKLQVLVIFMALFELLGVASVLPFMNFINSTDQEKAKILEYIPQGVLGVIGDDITLYFGIAVVSLLFLSSTISIITVSKLFSFAHATGADLSKILYSRYLDLKWTQHRERSSSEIIKNVTIECQRITTTILQPLVLLNARIVVACFLILALVVVNYNVALVASSIYALSYWFIFSYIKQKVYENGKNVTTVSEGRYRILKETFAGITEILIYNLSDRYRNKFSQASNKLANSMANNASYAQVPRYFMEFVSFGSVVIIILILDQNGSKNLSDLFPTLAFFGVVAMKLLPAFQQIFTSITHIQGSAAALEAIESDFFKNEVQGNNSNTHIEASGDFIIELKDVNFQYHPNSASLRGIQIGLEKGKRYGVVGRSGSGKSTLVNIIAKLIEPQTGEYRTKSLIDREQSSQVYIGYVPQEIFLKEGTIAENIAYGEQPGRVSQENIDQSIADSGLQDFVDSLPLGKFSQVSEDGLRLSGGQRQRIGIARALYRGPNLLIFDEATSALDSITEQKIIQTLLNLKEKNITIIMIAHRLSTLTGCDKIIVMKNGQIDAVGSFKDLELENDEFQAILLGE